MKHYRKDDRVQSLMIETNRCLYLGEDYSVDSERVEALIEVLRRVGEVIEIINFLVWIAKFGWKLKAILLGGDRHNQLILSRKDTILRTKI